MKRLGRFSWVVVLGVLVLSVGGNVTAAVLITSADIKDNTIRSVDVRDGAIASVDVGNGSLTSADIKDNKIRSIDVRDGTIASVDVGNGSLTGADVANNSLTGADIDESTMAVVADTDSAGGDLSGAFSDLQIASGAVGREELSYGSVGRDELASGSPQGCCVISFFEFTVPANACHTRAVSDPEANLGEIVIVFPESADLGAGVYMRPTVVAHPGEIIIETCNSTGSPVVIPFGTFFNIRLIA